jgi:hypothetical protein
VVVIAHTTLELGEVGVTENCCTATWVILFEKPGKYVNELRFPVKTCAGALPTVRLMLIGSCWPSPTEYRIKDVIVTGEVKVNV